MTEPEIKRELLLALEYSHAHEDWVEPLEALLAGLTPERAAARPIPGNPSIAEIVVHLALWNENIVERIRTGEKAHPPESWPAPGEWESDKDRLRASIESVRTTLEATSLDAIQSAGYGLADLLCRFTHLGYHLGQIEKLRTLTSSASA